jgi:hypothetical protein
MTDIVPPIRFSPDETPWARWAQQAISDLQRDASRASQAVTNVNNGQASTLTSLASQIVSVRGLQTGLAAQVAALVGQPISTSTVTTTSDINVGGNINVTGFLISPAGRATTVVTSTASAWFDGTGKLGINPSTVAQKQDFEPADTSAEVAALLRMALIRFRRTELVNELGDAAPWELGSIAEYVAQTALVEATFNDEEGNVLGIEWSTLVKPLIATVQALDARVKALEASIVAPI